MDKERHRFYPTRKGKWLQFHKVFNVLAHGVIGVLRQTGVCGLVSG
jgi:hypothetical protein